MSLRNSIILVILSICYMFVLRIINTVFPILAFDINWIIIRLILTIISFMIFIIFLLQFIREYIPENNNSLLNSSIAVFIGTLALLIINISNGLSPILPVFLYNNQSGSYFNNMVIWIYAFVINIFIFNIYLLIESRDNRQLKKYTIWAMAGASALFLLRSINMLNYFYYFQSKEKFLDLNNGSLTGVGILLVLFSFITILLFLINLRKSLPADPVIS